MVAGCPRTVSLPKEEMVALGKEMVAWVKQNKPIHLKQWYSFEKSYTYNEWKAMIQCPEFLPYYDKALGLVGMHYIDGTVDKSISQRFLRHYFKELKEEENEEIDYRANSNAKAIASITDEDRDRFDDAMHQIADLQKSAYSARKDAKMSRRAAIKSE